MEARSCGNSAWVAARFLLFAVLLLIQGTGSEAHDAPTNHHVGPSTTRPTHRGGHAHQPVAPVYEECYYDAHPFEGLVFFFTALTAGTVISFITMMPRFHGIQQTVVIFVLGLGYALLGEYYKLYHSTGMFGRSYCMWMNIDPHLLIFAMLPALITGDAMAIDTSVARRVYRQCIHLAGPGVLFCAFATALFLWWYLPYNWSFLLCLTVGSILAATDPVAVVNLLKELGASPALTVQIQGESLLNDGTAIVLYSVTYKMLEGEEFGTNDVVIFLLKVVLLATVLGCVLGWCCTVWIRLSCRRLDDHATFVQISITLLCAYWSYILAEGLFGMSGVLTTVSSALVLADRMWPSIVSKESMNNAWHMFEFMGNTAIFFLAGSWTGSIMYQIELKDYLHLFVIYLVSFVVRALMLVLSMPILQLLAQDKQPVTAGDAAVMCWGGLRGAVGLSLAIHLHMDRAGGRLDPLEGKRVLFFTSGIAALTLLVNATTCPLLVKWLGIARTSETRQTIMQAIHCQLVNVADGEMRTNAQKHPDTDEVHDLTNLVEQIMDGVLKDVAHHVSSERRSQKARAKSFLDGIRGRPGSTAEGGAQPRRGSLGSSGLWESSETRGSEGMSPSPVHGSTAAIGWKLLNSINSMASQQVLMDDGPKLIMRYNAARRAYCDMPEDSLELLRIPRVGEPADVEQLCELVTKSRPRDSLRRVVKEAFLCLLKAQYWAMNDKGEFLDDHDARSTLLESVGSACESSLNELGDLRFIVSQLMDQGDMSLEEVGYEFDVDVLSLDDTMSFQATEKNFFGRIMSSGYFDIIMAIIIVANLILVVVELSIDTGEEHEHERGYAIPLANLGFAIVYLIEFCIRFGALKWAYFCDAWNAFDFALLLAGLAGSVLEFLVMTDNMNQTQSARLARLARLLRVLRNVRIAVRAVLAAKQHGIGRIDVTKGIGGVISALRNARSRDQTQLKVRYILILTSFVKAHLNCQRQFVQYFGKDGRLETIEAARCLLASLTEVCTATTVACRVASTVERRALIALYVLRESNRVAEELLHFVDEAHTSGVLCSREAEKLQHPLKAHMRDIEKKLEQAVQGDFAVGKDPPAAGGVAWFRRALSLPPAVSHNHSISSSGSGRSGKRASSKGKPAESLDPAPSCVPISMPGRRMSLVAQVLESSEWQVRLNQAFTTSKGTEKILPTLHSDSAHSASAHDSARGSAHGTQDTDMMMALPPRAPSPPPSMPPSVPPSVEGSPPGSPRCATPPGQTTTTPGQTTGSLAPGSPLASPCCPTPPTEDSEDDFVPAGGVL